MISISTIPASLSSHSRSSSASSNSYQTSSHRSSNDTEQSPSSHCSTDDGGRFSTPVTPVLAPPELDSLKVYSSSLQNMTYQLFKNLHPDFKNDEKLSSIKFNFNNLTNFRSDNDHNSPTEPPIGFHSTQLTVQNTHDPVLHPSHSHANESNINATRKQIYSISKSMTHYPRRKRPSGTVFPDYTGL